MKVVYITETVMPEKGMATANRILSVCRGLAHNGCEVSILVPFSDNGVPENRVIDGVRIISFFRRCGRIGNALKWRLLYFFKVFCWLNRTGGADVAVAYSYSVMFNTFAWMVSKLSGARFVMEHTEFPIYIITPGRFSWFGIRTVLERFFVPKLPVGMILMTRKLVAFYSPIVRRSCQLHHLPMSVDCKRFNGSPDVSPFSFDYVAYMGSLNEPKDGVPGILKAFSIFAEKHPCVKLVRIGRARESDSELMAAFGKYCNEDRLVLTGSVQGKDIPSYLRNAKAIMLIRPDIPQTKACFPTKLGEYLASGTPVVTSPVGEVGDYLKDRESCYFADYNDPAAAAESLAAIFADAETAAKIGARGKQVALEAFHYDKTTGRLAEWLCGFSKSRKEN